MQPARKLTDQVVKDLPNLETQYEVRDTELKGFRVRVGKKKKTYCWQIEIADKTYKRNVGDAAGWTAQKARREAQKMMLALRAELAKPVIITDEGPTLRQAWEDYKVHLGNEKASDDTYDDYRITVEVHLAAWLDIPIRTLALNPKMMRDRHAELSVKRIEDGRRIGGPVAANHAARNLRAIYQHAQKAYPLILTMMHPSIAVTQFEEKEDKRAVLPNELASWWQQIQEISNPLRREFQLLMLLTGSRPAVLCKIHPRYHVNFAERALFLHKPKGGEERSFWVPMSDPMIECVQRVLVVGPALHQKEAKSWLFPAKSESGHIETWRPAGHKYKTGKALRQTFRTMAKKAGVDPYYSKLLMNHKLTREGDEVGQASDVHERYINVYGLTPELRAAQDKISAFIMDALQR